ncbi:hypothetical protein ACFSTD_13625 [Novosphingobium colocasiae]
MDDEAVVAVDSGQGPSYLRAMAHRLLLTLFALLTGLAAQIGPVEACVRQPQSVAVAPLLEATAPRAPRAPVALARLPEPGLRNARLMALPRPAQQFALPRVGFRPGIERAHE